MKMNLDALKALELKLAEYGKENGSIAEHDSSNGNTYGSASCGSCSGGCMFGCEGSCKHSCAGSCETSR